MGLNNAEIAFCLFILTLQTLGPGRVKEGLQVVFTLQQVWFPFVVYECIACRSVSVVNQRGVLCGDTEFRCLSNESCIPQAAVCDGIKDCTDESDEQDCDTPGEAVGTAAC